MTSTETIKNQSSLKSKVLSRIIDLKWEIALAVFCLFIAFWHLGTARLFDLDEGLYVSCAKQMVLTGNIITPQLNARSTHDPTLTHVPFFEKPIMVYWACAASLRIFGISELAARLPAAFATLGAAYLIVLSGRKWFSRRAGLFAGLVYITAPMTILDGRQMTTDALLVLWFTGALLAFWAKRPLLFWLCCALAVLTKGIVSLALPALVLSILLVKKHLTIDRLFPKPQFSFRKVDWNELLQQIQSMKPLLGIGLLLFITLPWHIAIWQAGGHDAEGRTWVQEYLVRQHIGRFKGMDKVHNAPFFTYIGYFLIGFFPWACFTPAAFRSKPPVAQNSEPSSGVSFKTFLLVWFWTIFVFFSISAAKLPTYIVPAYPAAALLVGCWLDAMISAKTAKVSLKRKLIPGALGAFGTAMLLLIASLFLPMLNRRKSFMPDELIGFAVSIMLILFVGSLAAFISFRFGRKRAILRGVLFYGFMMASLVFYVGIEGYALTNQFLFQPYQDMAAFAKSDSDRGIPVVYYHFRDRRPSMLFYANYSPYERKEAPLLPFLRDKLTTTGESDVIVTRKDYLDLLFPELSGAGFNSSVLNESRTDRGNWLLIRLIRKPAPSR